MSEQKHTPGPWKLLRVCNSIGIVPAKPAKGISKYAVEDIAILDVHVEQYDAEANARLIAAAPDLLAACERLWQGRAGRPRLAPAIRGRAGPAQGRGGPAAMNWRMLSQWPVPQS